MSDYIKGYQKAISDVLSILDKRCTTYYEAYQIEHDLNKVMQGEAIEFAMNDIKEGCEYDPNEEFVCQTCQKELDGRFLFCSKECEQELKEDTTEEE